MSFLLMIIHRICARYETGNKILLVFQLLFLPVHCTLTQTANELSCHDDLRFKFGLLNTLLSHNYIMFHPIYTYTQGALAGRSLQLQEFAAFKLLTYRVPTVEAYYIQFQTSSLGLIVSSWEEAQSTPYCSMLSKESYIPRGNFA